MAQDTPTPAPQGSGEPPADPPQAHSPQKPAESSDAGLSASTAEASGGSLASAPEPSAGAMTELDQVSIEELLKQANFEDPAALGASNPAAGAADFKLPNFQQVMQDAQVSSIDLLRDVELNVKIELGRARMFVED